ncbi:tricarboxylate carrier [Strigomonas culicis]|nr:tricarboxylate carrier [Strigomonas culicis]|eukprot:EPY29561.1 tricarboxylate carrier [Strigomonas culicis]
MSMFLPLNYVLVPLMMAPSTLTSVPRTFGVQLFNQTFNAAVNYANRSSDKQPLSEIAKAYGAAVTVACGGSLAATAMLKRLPPGTTVATLIRGTVPFLAVSCAAVVNVACMRQSEWRAGGQGIRVKDEDGVVRGQSTAAGWDSLTKCGAARVMWNTPCMVLPTLLMLPLSRIAAIRARPYMTECALQIVGITAGVPPALAAFNVVQTIDAAQLEPQFQGLTRKDGSPVRQYTYYKGL